MTKPGRPKGTIKTKPYYKLISVRIPMTLYSKVEDTAREEGQDVAGYVRRIIQKELDS